MPVSINTSVLCIFILCLRTPSFCRSIGCFYELRSYVSVSIVSTIMASFGTIFRGMCWWVRLGVERCLYYTLILVRIMVL